MAKKGRAKKLILDIAEAIRSGGVSVIVEKKETGPEPKTSVDKRKDGK